jgi:hypothetical protein
VISYADFNFKKSELDFEIVVFQINYPVNGNFFENVKQFRTNFSGVIGLLDLYPYYNHKVFSKINKIECYGSINQDFDFFAKSLKYEYYSKKYLKIEPLVYKDIEMNLLQRTCSRSGVELKLRNREFDLLKFFIENPKQVFSVEAILEYVWDMNSTFDTNTVQSHISFLRRKIDRDFAEKRLHTVPCVGYKFE